jgi:His-Xaa-Ser system protein HxsD
MRIDAGVYPIAAVYGAAYVFLDRCYVLLDKPDASSIRVTLSWKRGEPPAGALEALAGEFANELLSCAWRAKIAEESRAVIEATTAKALSGAMGPPSLDDLEGYEFGDEAFEDPLGIAMSWEEKYGKKKPPTPGPTGAGAGADAGAGAGTGTGTGAGAGAGTGTGDAPK